MNFSDLLAEFGHFAGLGALRFDERGLCRLSFDRKLVVDLEIDADNGALHIYSILGSLPGEGREALFSAMLAANLFGNGTGGATLAIDSVEEEVLLCRWLDADGLDVNRFADVLSRFVEHAEQWTARLVAPPPAEIRAETGGGLSGMMLRA